MPLKMTFKLEGLSSIMVALDNGGSKLIGPALRSGLQKSAITLRAQVERNAPTESGTMLQSVTHRISPKTIPLWAVVTTNAESKTSGARYPFVLEAGWRAYNKKGSKRPINSRMVVLYREGTVERLKGWFSGALRTQRRAITAIMENTLDDIAARWGQK